MLIHIEADRSLFTAYELAIQQRVKYVNDILQALLTARKRVFIYLYGILIRRTNGGHVFFRNGMIKKPIDLYVNHHCYNMSRTLWKLNASDN